jgi:hypothetical protein
VAAFIAMTAIATAQTAQKTPDQTGKGRATGNVYVDADKDGVCDNYENGTRTGRRAYSGGENQAAANRGPGKRQGLAQGQRHGQSRGQGVTAVRGAGRGTGQGQGTAPGRGQHNGQGQGTAPGRGQHNGQGQAFVDADKDGVCDNNTTATVKK